MKIRLPVRLFISYVVVVVICAAVVYLTVRLLAPRLFDARVGMMNGAAPGLLMGSTMAAGVRSAFLSAVNTALIVGVLASIAAAAAAAAAVAGRLARPLHAVRAATRQIAAGRYEGNIPLPSEPELAALASDVNTLAKALSDTETRRTRLLGDVAHEMRTPLTALDGYVEGLIDGVFHPNPQTLASLSEELRRLHRLADDLSSLSRVQEDRLELHSVDVDLADLTRRAAMRLAPQFQDAHIAIDVHSDMALPVSVDPDRITQVLTNLLGNALIATAAGGTVAVTARRSDRGQAEVVVADSGVGLSRADLGQVFERFYRGPAQPRRSSGSGIGLTIARGIAQAHGGDVTASSAGPGHGASFSVVLPIRR